MKQKIIFVISFIGVIGALASAYLFSLPHKPEQPEFKPTANPYDKGIYSNGIIESYQSNGTNANLYFEISGTVSKIFVKEGQLVKKGEPLLSIDDSVQMRITEQQKLAAAAALSLLNELRAQPRPEVLAVSASQVNLAKANLKLAQDQYEKQRRSNEIKQGSVSQDALDSALNALNVATKNLMVTEHQYDLVKAGAWSYDIHNQQQQYLQYSAAAKASEALLAKYVLKAPRDGIVLAINTTEGSYVSALGTYDSYTQGNNPIVVMASTPDMLEVRCYVDEILLSRLPAPEKIVAEMTIRGTDTHIPLQFDRMRPYVSPKIELSNQRLERVDVRVMPLIFHFAHPPEYRLYPGQLVDVYISQRQ
jgi:HlyD family secretion protein